MQSAVDQVDKLVELKQKVIVKKAKKSKNNLIFLIEPKLPIDPFISLSKNAIAINKPMLKTPDNCSNPLDKGASTSII